MSVFTENTKAIFIPDLAGSKPDWEALRKLVPPHVLLIEDACDTMSFTAASDISVVSFYPSHVLSAGGGGGMVMMNTEKQRQLALSYRDWGRVGDNSECMDRRFAENIDGIVYDGKFVYNVMGYNFKSTEMNAAFGIVQMGRLPSFLSTRRNNIERYIMRLSGSAYGMPNDTKKFDWLAMPVKCPPGERKNVMQLLESKNIQTRVFFAGNITRHPAYRHLMSEFSVADTIMADVLLVGAHHGMTICDIDYVCDVFLSFFDGAAL
jgi:CDP-6-deoxy-D-xylo-4-hexulose-3-dehydrase